MLLIKQIKMDGTEIDYPRQKITHEEAQQLVESRRPPSYIEAVTINKRRQKYSVGNQVMLVHEEGHLRQLGRNKKASELSGNDIVGDVIIVEWEKEDIED